MGPAIRLTSLAHGGGCGCKIAPGVLRQILGSAGTASIPRELLVGLETSDDAAVYQLNERRAVVATTDFFMPIVDNPYDFGMIAATNAISDVYAMGGTPIMALALVGMPVDKLPIETIRLILDGGEAVCARAGMDLITPGPSMQSFFGGHGSAAVCARAGARDTIDCGRGHDRVSADRSDVIRRNCEIVLRSTGSRSSLSSSAYARG